MVVVDEQGKLTTHVEGYLDADYVAGLDVVGSGNVTRLRDQVACPDYVTRLRDQARRPDYVIRLRA